MGLVKKEGVVISIDTNNSINKVKKLIHKKEFNGILISNNNKRVVSTISLNSLVSFLQRE